MKLWAGRFSKEADKKTNDFNSSIKTDSRMFNEDIDGSIAHASMLAAKGIISEEDCKKILAGLSDIRNDIISGELMIDPDAEDIHTFIEGELTSRIGDAGKRLHTGRSRNDQVAVDIRLYLKKDVPQVTGLINGLIDALDGKAKEYAHCIMPGYTHLQRAQPITFAAHIGAYIEMLRRDLGRFEDAADRMNYSPLGSGALAGTTYPIDRAMTAKALGEHPVLPAHYKAIIIVQPFPGLHILARSPPVPSEQPSPNRPVLRQLHQWSGAAGRRPERHIFPRVAFSGQLLACRCVPSRCGFFRLDRHCKHPARAALNRKDW